MRFQSSGGMAAPRGGAHPRLAAVGGVAFDVLTASDESKPMRRVGALHRVYGGAPRFAGHDDDGVA
jgi:hypothetical protein